MPTLLFTPDTVNYMIAGFAVIFGVMAIYLASLFWRASKLHQEETMLDELKKKTG